MVISGCIGALRHSRARMGIGRMRPNVNDDCLSNGLGLPVGSLEDRSTMPFKSLGSKRSTDGLRVEVTSRYLPRESSPDDDHYFFAYDVRITNEGPLRVRLLSRHWVIINADGDRHEVRGPGVVGETPSLDNGGRFEYTSFCPLDTPWGTMEGSFQMERPDGRRFEAEIGRFFLVAPVNSPVHADV
jgi:ApaG protein